MVPELSRFATLLLKVPPEGSGSARLMEKKTELFLDSLLSAHEGRARIQGEPESHFLEKQKQTALNLDFYCNFREFFSS